MHRTARRERLFPVVENPPRGSGELRKSIGLVRSIDPTRGSFGRIRTSVEHDDSAVARQDGGPPKSLKSTAEAMPLEAAAPRIGPPCELPAPPDAFREIRLFVRIGLRNPIRLGIESREHVNQRARFEAEDRTVRHAAMWMSPVVNRAKIAVELEKDIQSAGDHDIQVQEQTGPGQGHFRAEERKLPPRFRFGPSRHPHLRQGPSFDAGRKTTLVFGEAEESVIPREVSLDHRTKNVDVLGAILAPPLHADHIDRRCGGCWCTRRFHGVLFRMSALRGMQA